MPEVEAQVPVVGEVEFGDEHVTGVVDEAGALILVVMGRVSVDVGRQLHGQKGVKTDVGREWQWEGRVWVDGVCRISGRTWLRCQ